MRKTSIADGGVGRGADAAAALAAETVANEADVDDKIRENMAMLNSQVR